ncbi:MAG: DUF1254 domain-containing protein [Pseudomonadota bacterium]
MVKRILIGLLILIPVTIAFAFSSLRAELPKYRDAFMYAFGPYEFVRSVQDFSAQRQAEGGMLTSDRIREAAPDMGGGAVLNREIHTGELADHTLRTVTTPNNDTLYTSAVLELSQTPVELILPDSGDRYLSIALMDVFTDQFGHIGPRETGGVGGTYWIVGPDNTDPAPEGVEVIRATGNDVWLLARTFVAGQADLAAAREVQNGIRVRPVYPDRPPIPFNTQVTNIQDSENFLAVVAEALARNPDHPQATRAANFPKLKRGPDANYGPLARFYWSMVTPRAEATISAEVNEQLSAQLSWSAPPKDVGFYRENDQLRAAIALIGFGALRREDAIYYRMTRTEDGALLDGTKAYQMTLPPNVPAQAFWSISIYQPDETGRFYFFENPTGRHSLNSGSEGLSTEANGSIILKIGPTAPENHANWLPTPEGPFAAFFRLYLPTDNAVQTDWAPPPFVAQ